MQTLITPNQAGFVAGRKATDNIIIANKVIHTIKNKKGKGGFMVAKLDLSKAYDRISWIFIEQVLVKNGFPPNLIRLIMFCVSTVSYEIKWQGLNSNLIHPNCGLRQGDPLSPFLFILCLNELSKSLQEGQEKGLFFPIKVSRDHQGISHLFFADDILLFCRARPKDVRNILDIINSFCDQSGLEVNISKSNIYVFKNTHIDIRRIIKQETDIKVTTDLGKYLGLPILHSRISRDTFAMLLDKYNASFVHLESIMVIHGR